MTGMPYAFWVISGLGLVGIGLLVRRGASVKPTAVATGGRL